MTFANDFVWGVASSSFQIEGGHTDGRGDSIWDAFCRTPGKVYAGHTGQHACRSYERVEEDVDLIANLGVEAYRFSIAWPRVLPTGSGVPNEAGLAYYDRLVDGLLERGVDPWVTLYHWDLPLTLHHRGGWLDRDIASKFADYTAVVVDRLSDRVRHWMTLNEPSIFLGLGYHSGDHAPGLKLSRAEVLRATHHALLAHGLSTQVIRARASLPATVGWAPVGYSYVPATDDPASVEAARRLSIGDHSTEGWPHCVSWYADPIVFGEYPEDGLRRFGADAPPIGPGDMETICQPIDFFGFNNYSGELVRAGANGTPERLPDPPGAAVTQFGWSVRPEAIYWAARFLGERYKLPLVVTENGLASHDWVHLDGKVHDAARIDFLARYLLEIKRAIADGIDLRGYFQWSILDNFEWAEGYKMRFGLVHVDFRDGTRTPKDSYSFYKDVVASNGASLGDGPRAGRPAIPKSE